MCASGARLVSYCYSAFAAELTLHVPPSQCPDCCLEVMQSPVNATGSHVSVSPLQREQGPGQLSGVQVACRAGHCNRACVTVNCWHVLRCNCACNIMLCRGCITWHIPWEQCPGTASAVVHEPVNGSSSHLSVAVLHRPHGSTHEVGSQVTCRHVSGRVRLQAAVVQSNKPHAPSGILWASSAAT